MFYGANMAALRVYEKPTCTTCKNLAALLDARGVEWESVRYHDVGLTEPEIRDLLAKAGVGPYDLLRRRDPVAKDVVLPADPPLSDDALVALMAEHPTLLERPVVVAGDRAVLARPIERALELLE